MRIYKIDVKTLITALDIEKLTDVSKVYRDVHFQRGTKARLKEWLKSASTENEIREVWDFVKNLYNTQQKSYSELVEEYVGDNYELQRVVHFANIPDDKILLRFLDTYLEDLNQHLDSDTIRQMAVEFMINYFNS